MAWTSLKVIQLRTGFIGISFLLGVDLHTVSIFPVLVPICDRQVCGTSVPSPWLSMAMGDIEVGDKGDDTEIYMELIFSRFN